MGHLFCQCGMFPGSSPWRKAAVRWCFSWPGLRELSFSSTNSPTAQPATGKEQQVSKLPLTSRPRRQILLSGMLIRASLQETSVCIIDAAALLGDHTGHPGWCSVYPRILSTSNTDTDKLENHPKGVSDSTWTSIQKPRQHNPNCSLRKRLDSKWAPSTHTAISTWNYLNIIWDTSGKAQLASSHVSVCLSTYLRGVFRQACPA